MNIDDAKAYFTKAYDAESEGQEEWWPSAQVDFTCLAWTLALEIDAARHPGVGKYVCAAKGKKPERKAGILRRFGYEQRDGTKPGDLTHLNSEFLVDFSIYKDSDDVAEQAPVLTMESEMYARFEATHIVNKANGYGWDYSKLLTCPSRLRLFAARVGRVRGDSMLERRDELWEALTSLADLYHQLWDGPLVVYMLAERHRDRDESQVGVWTSGKFKRKSLFA